MSQSQAEARIDFFFSGWSCGNSWLCGYGAVLSQTRSCHNALRHWTSTPDNPTFHITTFARRFEAASLSFNNEHVLLGLQFPSRLIALQLAY